MLIIQNKNKLNIKTTQQYKKYNQICYNRVFHLSCSGVSVQIKMSFQRHKHTCVFLIVSAVFTKPVCSDMTVWQRIFIRILLH